jgi:hypothetical protein
LKLREKYSALGQVKKKKKMRRRILFIKRTARYSRDNMHFRSCNIANGCIPRKRLYQNHCASNNVAYLCRRLLRPSHPSGQVR